MPAAEMIHLRSRLRAGEPGVVGRMFHVGGGGNGGEHTVGVRDNGVGYSWACVKTVWWEKAGAPVGLVPGIGRTQGKMVQGQGGKPLILEVGMAVVRCANLRAAVSGVLGRAPGA
jgi:hypothetical protein